MSSNVVNTMPFIRASREFPDDAKQLSFQVNLTYVDVANAINARTIGLFPTSRPANTGESYYITNNQRQQAFRQIYSFTTTANIAHNINFSDIDRFVSIYGTYTDGTNWYGLLTTSATAIAGQVSFYVDPTNIIFVVGAGAPAVTKGLITLEWLSLP